MYNYLKSYIYYQQQLTDININMFQNKKTFKRLSNKTNSNDAKDLFNPFTINSS